MDKTQEDRIKKVELEWLEAQAEGFNTQEMDILIQIGNKFELQYDQIMFDMEDEDDIE
jgi:hypothetical protein